MAAAAVRSALAQTRPPLEVLVVVDGPDPETVATLSGFSGDVRVLALASPVGGGEARNTGVRAASGEWIAFLDDDDLWLPGKLEAQLAFARALDPAVTPVLSCPVLARGPEWEQVWPREAYRPDRSMAEYLFCRKGWSYGAALLQTSTLLAPRTLLLGVPFTPGLLKHQDWDWLLRAAAAPGVRVFPVGSAPLVVFHVEGERKSVGRARNWRFSLEWASARREFFTARAYSAFLATECAPQAGGAPLGERAALLGAASRAGLASWKDWARLLVFLFVPQKARRRLRDTVRGVRARFRKPR